MDIFKIPALLRAKKKITSLKDNDYFTISTKVNDLEGYDNRIITKEDFLAQISEDLNPNSYKEYLAFLTQSGTGAPSATILINTLGGTITWTRSSTGIYVGTSAGLFTLSKTIVNPPSTHNNLSGNVDVYSGSTANVNTVNISSGLFTSGPGGVTFAATDSLLLGAGYSVVRIIVYN